MNRSYTQPFQLALPFSAQTGQGQIFQAEHVALGDTLAMRDYAIHVQGLSRHRGKATGTGGFRF